LGWFLPRRLTARPPVFLLLFFRFFSFFMGIFILGPSSLCPTVTHNIHQLQVLSAHPTAGLSHPLKCGFGPALTGKALPDVAKNSLSIISLLLKTVSAFQRGSGSRIAKSM
jgi:hypothetical protein